MAIAPRKSGASKATQAVLLLIGAFSAIGILLLVAFFSRFTDYIILSGNTLVPYPGDNLLMDYALGVGWAILLGLGIYLWPGLGADRSVLLPAWAAKCAAALIIGLVFEQRYGLDCDGYFSNAIRYDFIWDGFQLSRGTVNIRNLTWLHLHAVPGSYHAAKVGFSMFGLIALYQFYKTSELVIGRKIPEVLLALALYPSVLFWSSTLGKDAPMLLGMALYVRGAVTWGMHRRGLPLVLVGCGIIALVRAWYLPIMLGPFAVMSFMIMKGSPWRLPLTLISMLALGLAINSFDTNFSVQDLIEQRSVSNAAFQGGGSSLETKEVSGLGDFVREAPGGLFLALFRPLPFEVPNLFGFIQGLENLFLLLLFLRTLVRMRVRELFHPVILWATLFVLSWALMYGLMTSNLGSLARYKLQILPVLLGLLLYLGRRRVKAVPAPQPAQCAA